MEHKFNYTVVGVFVLGFLASLIALIIWLTSGFEHVSTVEYKVITNESVSGLSVNSPVDYKGVNVGKVAAMQLDENDPSFVTIFLNIDVGTPIKKDTTAVLMSRGITGLINVSLTGGTVAAGPLLPTKVNPIPTIPNGASLSRRLDDALNNITHSLTDLSNKMGTILTTENIDHFSQILSNTDIFTADLAKAGSKFNTLTDETTKTIASIKPQVAEAAKSIASFAEFLQGSTQELEQLSGKLNISLDAAQSTLNSWDSLGQEADGSLQNIFPALESALYNFSLFMQELEAQPNSLILGKPKQKAGPGE